mmetsp:Transcript_2788/g.4265  ORF Transcript_2788/g.4265 Transcript_2788/m.4265 type:complete len:107 (-) Transcript_2788:328-648(-)
MRGGNSHMWALLSSMAERSLFTCAERTGSGRDLRRISYLFAIFADETSQDVETVALHIFLVVEQVVRDVHQVLIKEHELRIAHTHTHTHTYRCVRKEKERERGREM